MQAGSVVCVKSSLLDREEYVSRPGPGLVSPPLGEHWAQSQVPVDIPSFRKESASKKRQGRIVRYLNDHLGMFSWPALLGRTLLQRGVSRDAGSVRSQESRPGNTMANYRGRLGSGTRAWLDLQITTFVSLMYLSQPALSR